MPLFANPRPLPEAYGGAGPSCFPDTSCRGQGFMPTRDICILPQELPYQQRAFEPNLGGKNIPQMFCGGAEGYAMQVDLETGLRQISTRDPGGCNVYEFRDWGGIVPLICEWQQPDYRPLYFTDHTRNMIKDIGRNPEVIYDEANCSRGYGGVNTYTPYYDPRSVQSYGGYEGCAPGLPGPGSNACMLGWVSKSVGV